MTFGFAVLFAICGTLTAPVLAQVEVAAANEPSKRVFELSAYPGTVPFNSYPSFERWHAPFGTSFRVYKTGDGGTLEKERVITFFREHLTSKGWKENIFKRREDEPYLGMSIHLFENMNNGARIQLSGKFYLWIAPRDGMYTILLDQWRISTPGQENLNYLHKVESSLHNIATKAGYHSQKVASDSEWVRDFENEYLIDRRRFNFNVKGASGPHLGIGQFIDLIILNYRDPVIAEIEAKRFLPLSTNNGERVMIFPVSRISTVVVKGSNVFVLRDNSGKQAEALKLIATELEKL